MSTVERCMMVVLEIALRVIVGGACALVLTICAWPFVVLTAIGLDGMAWLLEFESLGAADYVGDAESLRGALRITILTGASLGFASILEKRR